MKKLMKFAWILAFLPILFFYSCTDKEDIIPQAEDRFEVLKTYLINENLDLNDILNDWITTAENVYTTMTDGDPSNDYFIIDIRSNNDFTTGHIEWAVNSTLGNILVTAENAYGKPIIVVCYTGQTAGHGVVALRLTGYNNAKVMKWGMSSWNPATAGPWNSHTGDIAIGNDSWINPPGNIQSNTAHIAPQVKYLTTVGSEILQAQVALFLENGFAGVTNENVLGNPGNYFINNYWAPTDVTKYGNITGAYIINPLSLKDGEYAYLDPGKKLVIYCWTGQTSSIITAYLNVIGYDAYSLKFGANGMIYSNLESHKWGENQIMNYPLAQ